MPYWRIMRCPDGHLFETPFLPFASFKAVRTPRGRYQRCPVDGRWGLMDLQPTAELTPEQLAEAHEQRTTPIP
jgi:hypothetical protein